MEKKGDWFRCKMMDIFALLTTKIMIYWWTAGENRKMLKACIL